MYYEIHGTGQPLLLLHGSFMAIEMMAPLIAPLAAERQVIAVELQGHGHTADVDRPFSYEQLADDVAAVLRHLGAVPADVAGYSLGGGVALQLAIRHPEVVRKLVVLSAPYNSDGQYPEVVATIEGISPELFAGTPVREVYDRIAPHPEAFPTLVKKLIELEVRPFDWPAAAIAAIAAIPAPTLIVVGDSDGPLPEHAVAMFRLRGGGVFGDIAGLPASQLAVLPGTTHVGVMMRPDLLLAMIPPFLDAPLPEGV
jgi:pimeloyl-ACP methyl ester carboxylesterase